MIVDNYKQRAVVLSVFVGVMWFVRVLDAVIPGYSSAGIGIVPRSWDGLDGIPVAPLIHADFEHLIANTLPLIVLGALVLLRGIAEFLFVTLISGLVAGVGTWLFGSGDGQHIGASGIVFGLFGYLVFRFAFDRRISTAIVALLVAIGYGASMVWGLVPQERISWSGHFFGFIGGILAARWRYPSWRARHLTLVRPQEH